MQNLKTIFICIFLASVLLGCKTNSAEKEKNINKEQSKNRLENISVDLFFQAALNGNYAYVEEGIKSGIDINSTDSEKRTALMLASFNGHLNIVKLLIEKGANAKMLDSENRSALMFASTGPFNSTVKELLKAGADVNVADSVEQFTAVMFAAAEGQLEVVKTLIANGADIKMLDIDGESAYDFAQSKGHTEVAEFIKSKL